MAKQAEGRRLALSRSIAVSFLVSWSVYSRHSHVKLLSFLSVVAALVGRADVRCTACVGVHVRAVFDYSGMFPHIIITFKYLTFKFVVSLSLNRSIYVYYNCCSWNQNIYWAWKHTVYHIATCCYVMCNFIGNRAFITVGVVGHGSLEDYHLKWYGVMCVLLESIFIIVAFARHGNSEY